LPGELSGGAVAVEQLAETLELVEDDEVRLEGIDADASEQAPELRRS